MERRGYLAAIGTAAAAGLAGCAFVAPGAGRSADPRERGPAGAPEGAESTPVTSPAGESGGSTTTATASSGRPLGASGFPADICQTAPLEDPGVYAIVEPAFDPDYRNRRLRSRYVGGVHDGEVAVRSGGLPRDVTIVGLEIAGTARAYPLPVLWIHELVNDSIEGRPVLVTYCPLCRSGMVARRRVTGETTTFRASGQLWAAPQLREALAVREGRVFGAVERGGEELSIRHAGNLVMVDDATGSYWSQILARAICGPQEGTTLDVLPSTVTTWGDWRATHPGTEVLLPPPYSGTTRAATGGD